MRQIQVGPLTGILLAPALSLGATSEPPASAPAAPSTPAEVVSASPPGDWRALDPAHTLYLELPHGRVIIELAPKLAPRHVANVETLVREKYFDGLWVIRVHENYVVQWGDPDGQKPTGTAHKTLAAEFSQPLSAGLPFTRLADGDVYAPEVGFSDGFPVARDPAKKLVWPAHCYGMVGAGRDNDADSGSGTDLYVVIGHAPRHLDRNVTLLGRVVYGMEHLTALPRGTGDLGFYEKPEQRLPIRSVRLLADVPAADRTELRVLRTESQTFATLTELRRNRRDPWYKTPAGKIDLCNVPIPVRLGAAGGEKR
jgi:peptidylprolyl isomerase